MTADERALLLAVHADPTEDRPRLVYADFLDDAGQPARAEFIRLQCDWHRAMTDAAFAVYANHLFNRLDDHVLAYGTPGPPDAAGAIGWAGFRRGLPTEATVRADGLAGDLGDVFLLAPLVRAEVWDASADRLAALVEVPARLTAGLRELRLVRPAFAGPMLGRLRERFPGLLVEA